MHLCRCATNQSFFFIFLTQCHSRTVHSPCRRRGCGVGDCFVEQSFATPQKRDCLLKLGAQRHAVAYTLSQSPAHTDAVVLMTSICLKLRESAASCWFHRHVKTPLFFPLPSFFPSLTPLFFTPTFSHLSLPFHPSFFQKSSIPHPL